MTCVCVLCSFFFKYNCLNQFNLFYHKLSFYFSEINDFNFKMRCMNGRILGIYYNGSLKPINIENEQIRYPFIAGLQFPLNFKMNGSTVGQQVKRRVTPSRVKHVRELLRKKSKHNVSAVTCVYVELPERQFSSLRLPRCCEPKYFLRSEIRIPNTEYWSSQLVTL